MTELLYTALAAGGGMGVGMLAGLVNRYLERRP